MNVSCKLTFIKVCSSTEPRGRTRRATHVSMVEFSCCWNHIYIESRPYYPTGFFCRLGVIFFPQKFLQFHLDCKKKKKSIMKKILLIYSICHWKKNDSLIVMDSKFICFGMFLWHGKIWEFKESRFMVIRLDAIQLRKRPLYTCS